jgi:hypothetical protein
MQAVYMVEGCAQRKTYHISLSRNNQQMSRHSQGLSQDDGRLHDTVTVPEVAYAVNFIDLLMMDTECVRNMSRINRK